MKNKIFIFILGFLCAFVLFFGISDKTIGKANLSDNVSFSGESNVMYFFDREGAKLYRYNTQGRLTRTYIIEELGKDLQGDKQGW